MTELTPREVRLAQAKARLLFKRGSRVEGEYARSLRSVAQQVGAMVRTFAPDGVLRDWERLKNILSRYADMLDPWARSIAEKTVLEISRKDASAWTELGNKIGVGLHREIELTPVGDTVKSLIANQVGLITSIPKSAAQRLEDLTFRMLEGGLRSEQVAERVKAQGNISLRKANNIARDLAHAGSSALTMARAEYVGAQGYIWQTARDSEVRKLHRELQGKYIDFDNPPVAGEHGERAHAGMIYGCRCWMAPVLPEKIS